MAIDIITCKLKDGTEFKGLYEIQPKVFGDSRGYFLETYSERDFFSAGLTMKFIQDKQSKSTKGVLRGLHLQTQHPQGKLVRTILGKVFDVAVDLRKGSSTFGKYYGVVLDSEKQNQFYIPVGFAHGFYVLSDNAIFAYKCTDFYDPKGEAGIIWNDPVLDIKWPFYWQETPPVLSDKDKNLSLFDPSADYFDKNGQWIQN